MTEVTASSLALHRTRGVCATPKRLRDFAATAGIAPATELHEMAAPQLAAMLVPVPGITTASELARSVCRDCGLNQDLLDQAQTVFAETGQPYPAAFDALIKQLIDQFNQIDERTDINALQRDVLKAARTPSEGLKLAQRVAAAVEKTRAKDLAGCRIAMLTTLFDQTVAATQTQHRQATTSCPEPFRAAVCKAHQHDGALAADLFTKEERHALAAQLGYPATSDELYEALQQYLEEAQATMHIELSMQ